VYGSEKQAFRFLGCQAPGFRLLGCRLSGFYHDGFYSSSLTFHIDQKSRLYLLRKQEIQRRFDQYNKLFSAIFPPFLFFPLLY